jgi:hypothetical protein
MQLYKTKVIKKVQYGTLVQKVQNYFIYTVA